MKIKFDLRFFLLLTAGSIVAFFASVILHNLFYALLGLEEAVFFIIAVFLCPLALLAGVVGTIVMLIKKIFWRDYHE